MLTVSRGAALYVGALVGPGLLLVPGLAAEVAGPASVLAWAALIALSAPIAATFARLGARHPVPGGVTAYVREAFGPTAAAVTGTWFVTAVVAGGPTVALIGGLYVADLTGGGRGTAVATGLVIFVGVLAANVIGLRMSSGLQLALSTVLVSVVAVAVVVSLPSGGADRWTPFAPHGWWAVGSAANLLIWLIIGWEAMAQLAGEFASPARDLPRAVALAFLVIAALYAGLGVATVVVTAGHGSAVPLADLMAVAFGPPGRHATAVLAVVLTAGTMNVYTASSARLAAALATAGALPAWLGGDHHRDVPRRPLLALAVTGPLLLAGLGVGLVTPAAMVRGTSACFVAVYLLSLASAARILTGRARALATLATALVTAVAAFSAWYLLVPLAAAVLTSTVARLDTRVTSAA
jgi:amino acid efflux transporter